MSLTKTYLSIILQDGLIDVLKDKLETIERFKTVTQFWLGAEFMSNGQWKWTHNRQSFDGMYFVSPQIFDSS